MPPTADTTQHPAPPPAPSPSTADGPKPAPTRLPALDVLRGIAILGTLLTNIWIFSVSVSGDLDQLDATLDETPPLASFLQTALDLVTDGKFIGLLTIMFGIGLEIQRQSALRKGEKWPGRYPWRAGLLIVDGILNYIFVFEFDVLMGYGLTGLIVCVIMARSPKAQKIWMWIGIAAHLALISFLSLGSGVFQPVRKDEAFVEMPVGTDIPADMMPIGTESYWAMVAERLTNFVGGRAEIPIMIVMGLGLFLVGAHLYRAGIFEARGARLRKWTILLAFGVGLPIDWYLRLGQPVWAGAYPRYVTSSFVAFGILAAVAAYYVRRSGQGRVGTGRVGGWLSLIGRMALTCYIGQNLLAGVIFHDWGFGLARAIEGPHVFYWTMLVFVLMSAFLVAFCALWLRRFSRGPVELVWHWSYDAICRALDRRAARRADRRARREATPTLPS